MSKTPLVSIVITNYNYADYVGDAIKSALNQSYTNIEIIIIDDGSTDNSIEVLKKYEKNKKIKIVSRENKGIIYTRNEGVRLSNGVFVMQLDADDTLESTYVQECLDKAQNSQLDIVYTQTHTFGRVEFDSQHIDFDLEILKHYGYMHAASLVRKSKMKDDPYDRYLEPYGNEDWDMFLDMCLDGATAGLVDRPLLNYRKHIDRKSRADDLEGLYKEALVQHHIWTKQNEKHPDQFWYFSSMINALFGLIKFVEENQKLQGQNDNLKERLKKVEHRKFIYENTKLYGAYQKIKKHRI